jgi:hypothetical protein
MDTLELLMKAEENVNKIASIPFEERLAKSLMPEKESGSLVFLTESERIALEIGKELVKAYNMSADDGGEDEEEASDNDDDGFDAATEGDDDDEEEGD